MKRQASPHAVRRIAASLSGRAVCKLAGPVNRETLRVRGRDDRGPIDTLRVTVEPRSISRKPEIRGATGGFAETLCPPRETKKRREECSAALFVNQWVR